MEDIGVFWSLEFDFDFGERRKFLDHVVLTLADLVPTMDGG